MWQRNPSNSSASVSVGHIYGVIGRSLAGQPNRSDSPKSDCLAEHKLCICVRVFVRFFIFGHSSGAIERFGYFAVDFYFVWFFFPLCAGFVCCVRCLFGDCTAVCVQLRFANEWPSDFDVCPCILNRVYCSVVLIIAIRSSVGPRFANKVHAHTKRESIYSDFWRVWVLLPACVCFLQELPEKARIKICATEPTK